MGKTIKTQIIDQLGHMLYGGGIAAVLLVPGCLPRFYPVIIAAIIASIREIEQYFRQDERVLMLPDRLLDISTFLLGAALVGFAMG